MSLAAQFEAFNPDWKPAGQLLPMAGQLLPAPVLDQDQQRVPVLAPAPAPAATTSSMLSTHLSKPAVDVMNG